MIKKPVHKIILWSALMALLLCASYFFMDIKTIQKLSSEISADFGVTVIAQKKFVQFFSGNIAM